MPTGQSIINNALTNLGIREQGATPSVSDSNDALDQLNVLWDAWSVDEGLIWEEQPVLGPLVANKGGYTVGTAGDIVFARPGRIYRAFIVGAVALAGGTTALSKTVTAVSTVGLYVGMAVYGTGIPAGAVIEAITANTSIAISIAATLTGAITFYAGGTNRNELTLINAEKYYRKNDLGALSQVPEEMYPDFNPDSTNSMKVFLWPLPLVITPQLLELDCAVTFAAWALVTNYNLPKALQDDIEWSLAARLITRYGEIVDGKTAELCESRAAKADARYRNSNATNRQLPPEAVGLKPPAEQGA